MLLLLLLLLLLYLVLYSGVLHRDGGTITSRCIAAFLQRQRDTLTRGAAVGFCLPPSRRSSMFVDTAVLRGVPADDDNDESSD